jgi:transposase
VSGRKRQLVVDTPGVVLTVLVWAAAVHDRDGARFVAHAVRLYGPDVPRRSLVGAAAGSGALRVDARRQPRGWKLAVLKRADPPPRGSFAVQPQRGIVERTCSWGGGLRRLSRDDDSQVESSAALIYGGMSHLLLRRLARSPATDVRSIPAA